MQILSYEFPPDWDSLELFPLSDLHVGDKRTDVPLFRKFVKYIAAKPNRRWVYNGDNLNMALKNSKSNVYNDSMLDEETKKLLHMPPNEQRKWLIHEIEPIVPQCLGLLDGNHEERTTKEVGFSIVETMAEKFNVPYSSDVLPLKISFGKDSHSRRITYGVYVAHGTGAGGRIGATINKAEDVALMIEGCDVVILGHVHKKGASKPAVLVMDMQNNVMRQRDKLCVVSSHWCDYGGYAAKGLMRPGSKGAVPVTLNGCYKEAIGMV
jgi:hypothetical protein